MEFATIRVAKTALGTNSGLTGDYTLSVAERDTLELIFSCIGYKTEKRTFIKPSGHLTCNIKLSPNDVELKEFEVVGFRKQVNGMQTFDTESMKLSPDVSGGSVEALISTMPGVHSSNEMSSQYSVRGGSFDENSAYINGMEIYRPQLLRSGQQEGLSIINPKMVGNIKFSSGGFPARYADKMSSALEITYREPKALETAVDLSLMGGSLTVGQSTQNFSQLHGVRFKKNNSLLSSLETRGEYDPLFFDYQTNLTWNPTKKLTFNLLGNISVNHYNFVPHTRETSFGTLQDAKHFKVYFDGAERDRFETFVGALSATYRPDKSSAYSLGLSGFHANELVSYDISGEYWLNQAGSGSEGIGGELGVGKYMEHARDRLTARVMNLFFRGENRIDHHKFNYGWNIQRENFRDRSREWEWRDSAGYSLPTLPEGVHLIYNLISNQDISTTRTAAYLEDAMWFESDFAQFAVNAGLRASYWSFNRETLLSPRINVNITPENNVNWVFRFATGVYYQSPFYKEFRITESDKDGNQTVSLNRNIRSPRSIQFIGGTDYTFRAMERPFKITGELFYKHLSNFISYEYDNLKVNYSGINDSKGYAAGVDFKLFGQFVEGTDSWISASLMKTSLTLDGRRVPLPTDQRYQLSMYFTDYFPRYPKMRFALRGIFADGLTMTPPHVSRSESWFRAPAYKRIDVGLTYLLVGGEEKGVRPYDFRRHFKEITIGFDCFNLLDIANVSSYYWVTDVNNIRYAVPNYLTSRQFNLRLSFEL